jgi:integrase
MPTNLQKRLERPTRKHLSIDQVRAVIASDSIYVAFPFLAGTRISEQLGLCWDCVDFDAGVVHIKRAQDKQTDELIETTKTASGQRIIPMSETLRRMLAEWKPACPSLEHVFPAPQGGVLLYFQFPSSILATRAPTNGTATSKHSFGEGELHINASSKRRRCCDRGEAGRPQDAERHPSILHSFAA